MKAAKKPAKQVVEELKTWNTNQPQIRKKLMESYLGKAMPATSDESIEDLKLYNKERYAD